MKGQELLLLPRKALMFHIAVVLCGGGSPALVAAWPTWEQLFAAPEAMVREEKEAVQPRREKSRRPSRRPRELDYEEDQDVEGDPSSSREERVTGGVKVVKQQEQQELQAINRVSPPEGTLVSNLEVTRVGEDRTLSTSVDPQNVLSKAEVVHLFSPWRSERAAQCAATSVLLQKQSTLVYAPISLFASRATRPTSEINSQQTPALPFSLHCLDGRTARKLFRSSSSTPSRSSTRIMDHHDEQKTRPLQKQKSLQPTSSPRNSALVLYSSLGGDVGEFILGMQAYLSLFQNSGQDFFESEETKKILLLQKKQKEEQAALADDTLFHWERTSTGWWRAPNNRTKVAFAEMKDASAAEPESTDKDAVFDRRPEKVAELRKQVAFFFQKYVAFRSRSQPEPLDVEAGDNPSADYATSTSGKSFLQRSRTSRERAHGRSASRTGSLLLQEVGSQKNEGRWIAVSTQDGPKQSQSNLDYPTTSSDAATGQLGFCSDDRAVGHLEDQLEIENLDLSNPPKEMREKIMQLLLDHPQNQGDAFIRMLMKTPQRFGVSKNLVREVLRQFYLQLWKEQDRRMLTVDILSGTEAPAGTVLVERRRKKAASSSKKEVENKGEEEQHTNGDGQDEVVIVPTLVSVGGIFPGDEGLQEVPTDDSRSGEDSTSSSTSDQREDSASEANTRTRMQRSTSSSGDQNSRVAGPTIVERGRRRSDTDRDSMQQQRSPSGMESVAAEARTTFQPQMFIPQQQAQFQQVPPPGFVAAPNGVGGFFATPAQTINPASGGFFMQATNMQPSAAQPMTNGAGINPFMMQQPMFFVGGQQSTPGVSYGMPGGGGQMMFYPTPAMGTTAGVFYNTLPQVSPTVTTPALQQQAGAAAQPIFYYNAAASPSPIVPMMSSFQQGQGNPNVNNAPPPAVSFLQTSLTTTSAASSSSHSREQLDHGDNDKQILILYQDVIQRRREEMAAFFDSQVPDRIDRSRFVSFANEYGQKALDIVLGRGLLRDKPVYKLVYT
ncbi:unnamed protein product [Amoebophrya sp. A25]|nr:unnamed protein product [Amoebophrya sp. A25]|eukprot:GSA25T00019454001.1